MSTTYIIGSTNSDVVRGTNNKYFETATGATSGITVNLAKSGSQSDFVFTRPNVPGLTGAGAADGTYSVSINITAANANVVMNVYVANFTSTGASIDGTVNLILNASLAATGLQTGSAAATFATAFGSTDRIGIILQFANSASMATAAITYEVLGSGDFLTAPFGGAVAADFIPYRNPMPPIIAQ